MPDEKVRLKESFGNAIVMNEMIADRALVNDDIPY
jgi:hypothetical protein